jgi:recombinational DNA repair protein RecR
MLTMDHWCTRHTHRIRDHGLSFHRHGFDTVVKYPEHVFDCSKCNGIREAVICKQCVEEYEDPGSLIRISVTSHYDPFSG